MKKDINWKSVQSRHKKIPSNTTLIVQGEKPTFMYVLLEGTLNTYRNKVMISTIKNEGEYIGEISILLNTEHTATVVTQTEAMVLEISKETIEPFLTKSPDIAISLAINLANRLVEQNTLLANTIVESSFKYNEYSSITNMYGIIDLYHLSHLFVDIRPNVEVIIEKEKPKALYILVDGIVEIFKGGKSIAVESTPGIYFGDVSILRGSNANATVKTKTKTTLIEIPQDKVDVFLTHSPEIAISIARKLAQRILAVNDEFLNLKAKQSKKKLG